MTQMAGSDSLRARAALALAAMLLPCSAALATTRTTVTDLNLVTVYPTTTLVTILTTADAQVTVPTDDTTVVTSTVYITSRAVPTDDAPSTRLTKTVKVRVHEDPATAARNGTATTAAAAPSGTAEVTDDAQEADVLEVVVVEQDITVEVVPQI